MLGAIDYFSALGLSEFANQVEERRFSSAIVS